MGGLLVHMGVYCVVRASESTAMMMDSEHCDDDGQRTPAMCLPCRVLASDPFMSSLSPQAITSASGGVL